MRPGIAQRDADVLPAHGASDRLGDRCLADARWTDEEQDRPLGGAIILVARHLRLVRLIRCHLIGRCLCRAGLRFALLPFARGAKLSHGQELEHAVLDVLEAVVVLVEDLGRLTEVEVVLAAMSPRQLGDGLEVGADHLVLHRIAVRATEPAELAVHFLSRLLRQVESRELLRQIVGILSALALAQLALDRLELLAQHHFPLTVPEFLLDLRLDLLLRVDHADLALYVHQHSAQPLLDREGLEQRLSLLELELEVVRHEIRQSRGVSGLG
jgi:hypothetical protein